MKKKSNETSSQAKNTAMQKAAVNKQKPTANLELFPSVDTNAIGEVDENQSYEEFVYMGKREPNTEGYR